MEVVTDMVAARKEVMLAIFRLIQMPFIAEAAAERFSLTEESMVVDMVFFKEL